MRKSFFAVVFCIVFMGFVSSGCSDSKPEAAPDSLSVDSLAGDSADVDSIDSIISETPMPKAADALFDDFFFNFVANRKLQLERVKFPLRVVTDGKVSQMQKNEWKNDHFFMRQGYYTLLFDNVKQLDMVKDTSVKDATVEKIYLSKKKIEQYKFHRIRGAWMLTEIETIALQKSHNASFLQFYDRFSRDEAYQLKSLHEPVKMTVPDPDDDFKMMTGDIYPEQWVDYKPQILPKGFIYNINYGQRHKGGNECVFVIRGIANGLETQLTFKKMSGGWKLVQFIN